MRHILRIIGWNLLFILAGLLVIGVAGETYFRLNARFGYDRINLADQIAYWRFVPGVGLLRQPQIDLVFSNGLNVWTVQRANSLGFLDREPIDPERAAESCHITIIGDSFVEGREVYISDKMQVRLEEIAAREAPHLDVTTSAFGFSGTGQVNQLPFYDRYAKRMSPDMIVLVFVSNDPRDNSAARYALTPGYVPDRLPYGHAVSDGYGGVIWVPPAVDFSDPLFSRGTESLNSWSRSVIYRVASLSYFMRQLYIRTERIGSSFKLHRWFLPPETAYKRYRDHTRIMKETMTTHDDIEMWGFTSFGLEQFKRRADHDGAALMILTNYDVGEESAGYPVFDSLSMIAQSLGIPVVSQKDYIIQHGGDIHDAHLMINYHWNPTGHRWAAEAVWEYIEEEWEGKCPEAEHQPDIEVDWISIGDPSDEVEYEGRIQTFQEPFGLHHRIHTPRGEAWVQSFPTFDSKKYRSAYESVTSRRPTVRSDWDVHLYDDGLTYIKEPCAAADVEHIFFLHVVPENNSDLAAERQLTGFDNLDFHFGIRGAAFDRHCMVSADLPDYDIASIRTGQLSDGVQTWRVDYNFALPSIMDVVQELQQSGREPEIRSNFDVYIDDGRLVYMKTSCNSDDRDLPFFLHVIPADANDIPQGREESGFDNLGFELMQNGGQSDGVCFATVDLPEYKIASIRTGQWVRGEGEVWDASIEFGR